MIPRKRATTDEDRGGLRIRGGDAGSDGGSATLERSPGRGHLYRPGTKTNGAPAFPGLTTIDRKFAERPDLREAVTLRTLSGQAAVFAARSIPHCRRTSSLVSAGAAVTPTGRADSDGRSTQDVIVMAGGFRRPTTSRIARRGRDSRTLQDDGR